MSVGTHFDMAALAEAIEERRQARGVSWAKMTKEVHAGHDGFAAISASSLKSMEVVRDLPRCNMGVVRRMAAGQQIGRPHGMHLFLWLDEPAASFTRGIPRGPELVSVKKAAKELRISLDELDTLLLRAGVETRRFGGSDLVTRKDVDRLKRAT
jgi:hypothetical protein